MEDVTLSLDWLIKLHHYTVNSRLLLYLQNTTVFVVSFDFVAFIRHTVKILSDVKPASGATKVGDRCSTAVINPGPFSCNEACCLRFSARQSATR